MNKQNINKNVPDACAHEIQNIRRLRYAIHFARHVGTPYAAGTGRLDTLLNGAMTVGLLLITAPKGAWTFARGSKWGAALNAAVCGYLLFAHVTGKGGGGGGGTQSGGGDGSGVRGGGGAGNHLLATVGYAALLFLAAPGLLRIF